MTKLQHLKHLFGRHCWHPTQYWRNRGTLDPAYGPHTAVCLEGKMLVEDTCCHCGGKRVREADTYYETKKCILAGERQ